MHSEKVKYVFITNALKNYYCERYPKIRKKDTLVLPDGADVDENINRKRNSNDLSCVYMGSFYPGKGLQTVIQVAKSIPVMSKNGL